MFGRMFEGIETPKHFGEVPKFHNGAAPENPEFGKLNIPKFSNWDDVPEDSNSTDEIWDDIPEIPDFSKK